MKGFLNLDNSLLKQILKEYDIKRNKAIQEAEERKKKLLEINPRLSELDLEISKLSIQTTKLILNSSNSEKQKLKFLDYSKLYKKKKFTWRLLKTKITRLPVSLQWKIYSKN